MDLGRELKKTLEHEGNSNTNIGLLGTVAKELLKGW